MVETCLSDQQCPGTWVMNQMPRRRGAVRRLRHPKSMKLGCQMRRRNLIVGRFARVGEEEDDVIEKPVNIQTSACS